MQFQNPVSPRVLGSALLHYSLRISYINLCCSCVLFRWQSYKSTLKMFRHFYTFSNLPKLNQIISRSIYREKHNCRCTQIKQLLAAISLHFLLNKQCVLPYHLLFDQQVGLDNSILSHNYGKTHSKKNCVCAFQPKIIKHVTVVQQ